MMVEGGIEKMIKAVVKMQGCTTKPGRRAFVVKNNYRHGIANGVVRFYEVTGPTWAAIRNAIANYDTTGGKTMGFSGANADTVEFYITSLEECTGTSIRPLPLGTTAQDAHRWVSWGHCVVIVGVSK